MNDNSWLLEVVSDLEVFAAANGLQQTAQVLHLVKLQAVDEIGSKANGFEVGSISRVVQRC